MDHLGAGIGLLVVIGEGYRIEFTHRVIAFEHATGILPGDGRARLDLGPADARVIALAHAPLGYKIVDATHSVGITCVPVLHRGVLDIGAFQRDQFDHGRMQLVGIELRRRAALEVAHLGALFGHDQRALELAGFLGVDAKVGREFHRAFDAARNEAKRAIGEHRSVECGVEIVVARHHGAQVATNQLRVLLHRLGERAENDTGFGQALLVGGGYRD